MGMACAAPYRTPDAATEARVDAAIDRRQDAEGSPAPLRLWIGIPCIALGVVQAFWPEQPQLLYALMCFVLAIANGVAFLRLKNSQPKRVAVLESRTPGSVIPAYWFAAAALSCASMVVFIGENAFAVSALVVFVSASVTALIAWRLTQLPSLLSGVDLPAEQIVDDQLRRVRSSVVLFCVFAQTFALACMATPHAGVSTVQSAVYAWNWFPWIVFGLWVWWRIRRPMNLAPA